MKNLALIIISLISLLLACSSGMKRIQGSGHVISIERTTEAYDAISVSGYYNVELVHGREGDLILKGEDNILENIKTEVRDGTLHIKPIDNQIHFVPSHGEEIFITIPVDEISAIHLSGTGDLVGKKTLTTKELDVRISGSRNIELTIDTDRATIATSGSSNIQLEGASKDLEVRSSGSSNVKAYELEVDNASFELSGSSNVQITVNESLTSRVSGSGNISYRGTPVKVNSQVSGSGSVSKK